MNILELITGRRETLEERAKRLEELVTLAEERAKFAMKEAELRKRIAVANQSIKTTQPNSRMLMWAVVGVCIVAVFLLFKVC